MSEYTFAHDGPVYVSKHNDFDVAYYARDGKKYKRWRYVPGGQWNDANEQEITDDMFWMAIACIEWKAKHA